MQAAASKAADEVLTTRVNPLSSEEAGRLVSEHFSIPASSVSPLDSERDQNFRITAANGKQYVLKIANPAEPRAVTNLQTEALRHIAAADQSFPVPRVIPAKNGDMELALPLGGNPPQVVRLISYLQGAPLSSVERTSAQRKNLGAALARLGLALRGFSHPAADHELLWDIKNAGKMRPLLEHIQDTGRRALAEKFLKNFDDHVAPVMPRLRAQVIHSDFHPDNILVEAGNHDIPAGVIDFGDCVHTMLINDLAIACSYQITDECKELLDFSVDLTTAYHQVSPLKENEIDILYDLIAARLVTGVAINGWRAALYPENAGYLLSYDSQKWRALERLAALPREEAQKTFRRACGME